MRFRRIALLIGLYVALDFANPLLPGAVQLVDASVETVAGCHARSVQVPTQGITFLPRHLLTVEPRDDHTPLARHLLVSGPPPPLQFRAAFESRRAPASSPDDD